MKKLTFIAIFISFFLCTFAQIKTVSVEEFEKLLTNCKGEQLIDIRTPQEFEKYRIRSARNMDSRNTDFRKNIETLNKNKPVFIYCLSGARSKASLEVFQELGFKTVYDLGGGINAWSKAGMPIDQDLSGKGELSVQSYDSIVSGKGYVLVDFYAPWCKPCQKMLPVVQDLAKTYPDKFQLLTVDFDKNRLLSKEKNVKSVPYLVIFKDGKKIWEKLEETTREEILKVLKIGQNH